MRRCALSLLPAMAAALLLLPATGVGQEVIGTAVGPHGEPLAGVVVALHRIGDMGGANVASVTTDAEGRFRFQVEVPDSALYFAAMRYADRMYIGPPAMAGVERVADYVLAADPSAEAGAVASALSGDMQGRPLAPRAQAPRTGAGAAGGSRTTDTALLLVGLLALTAAALFLFSAPRQRRRRTRDALVELATVENRLADGPHDDERQELLGRRHQLRRRLARPA